MKNLLLPLLLIYTLTSCQTNQSEEKTGVTKKDTVETTDSNKTTVINPADTLPPALAFYINDTLVEGDDQMVYIESVFKKDSSIYIDADYIGFLMGDKAFEAARVRGGLDTSYTYEGDKKITHVGLSNDYYILNDNKKIRTLRASKDIVTETIYWGEETYYLKRISLDSLYNIYKNDEFGRYRTTPFSITIRKGQVVKIEEVYIP